MTTPTLEDDSFIDPAIAQVGICLWDRQGGGVTNAVQLLVRPLDVRSDEAGGHPGESFVMVTITREEMRAMLNGLERDWRESFAACGDGTGFVLGGAMKLARDHRGYDCSTLFECVLVDGDTVYARSHYGTGRKGPTMAWGLDAFVPLWPSV